VFGLDPVGQNLVVNPALPDHLELLDIPGRWDRTDAYGRGRKDITSQRMT
jgi:hypothetical protein